MEYRTKQTGWVILLISILILLSMSIFLMYIKNTDPTAIPALITTNIIFVFLMLLFGTLETTVTSSQIKIKFGIGLIKKTIPLADIESITEVKNKFWYGWGIRLTPHGWLWNIAGYEAVEIKFKSNRKNFRIGCKSSKELYKAIKKHLK